MSVAARSVKDGVTERQSDTQSNVTKSFRGSQRDLNRDLSQAPIAEEDSAGTKRDDDAACKLPFRCPRLLLNRPKRGLGGYMYMYIDCSTF